ncbi:endonuclease VII domain-containing protein [Streptomyces sp. ECR3.8]|uniref:endonuclease VII domain-containing protein n=1 Tax=Streptomyces sp. ECR3.8 TaxID=3461009 RepID=UPI0040416451
MATDSRRCTKCAVDKPLSEFSKAPRGKYGRKASCKACDAARHAAAHPPRPRKRPDEEAERARYEARWAQPKKCNGCGETKSRTEFYKAREGKYGPLVKSTCKACDSERARKWFADNSERSNENRRRWNLQNTYGISVAEYNALLREQGGVCAICGRDEPNAHGRTGKQFRLAVDHCHESGAVRGLLCQKCNRAIGLLGDDPVLMRKAIGYLLRHRAQPVE